MEGASGRHAHQQCDDVHGYLQLSGTLQRMTNWSAAPAHTEAYNVHAAGANTGIKPRRAINISSYHAARTHRM